MYPPMPPVDAEPDPTRIQSSTYRYIWRAAGALEATKIGFGTVPITEGLRQEIEKDTTRRLLKGSGH